MGSAPQKIRLSTATPAFIAHVKTTFDGFKILAEDKLAKFAAEFSEQEEEGEGDSSEFEYEVQPGRRARFESDSEISVFMIEGKLRCGSWSNVFKFRLTAGYARDENEGVSKFCTRLRFEDGNLDGTAALANLTSLIGTLSMLIPDFEDRAGPNWSDADAVDLDTEKNEQFEQNGSHMVQWLTDRKREALYAAYLGEDLDDKLRKYARDIAQLKQPHNCLVVVTGRGKKTEVKLTKLGKHVAKAIEPRMKRERENAAKEEAKAERKRQRQMLAATVQENLNDDDYRYCGTAMKRNQYGGGRALFDGELALSFAASRGKQIEFVPVEWRDQKSLEGLKDFVTFTAQGDGDKIFTVKLTPEGSAYMERVTRALETWRETRRAT